MLYQECGRSWRRRPSPCPRPKLLKIKSPESLLRSTPARPPCKPWLRRTRRRRKLWQLKGSRLIERLKKEKNQADDEEEGLKPYVPNYPDKNPHAERPKFRTSEEPVLYQPVGDKTCVIS